MQYKIFDDIFILIDKVKEALENEKLNSYLELYDAYRHFCKVLFHLEDLLEGDFVNDLDLDIYQLTESFPSPIEKWAYFSNERLAMLNKKLHEFVNSLNSLKFDRESSIVTYLHHNLLRKVRYLPCKTGGIGDKKIFIGGSGKNLIYVYHIFKECKNPHGMYICQELESEILTFDVYDKNKKNELIIELHNIKDTMRLFRTYIEKYLQKHAAVKDLICNCDKFLLKNLKIKKMPDEILFDDLEEQMYPKFSQTESNELEILNDRLKSLQDKLTNEAIQIGKYLKSRVEDKNDLLDDYEMELTIDCILKENDKEYKEGEDNTLVTIEVDVKNLEDEILWWEANHNDFYHWEDHIMYGEYHCYLFHHLYDHTVLEWSDILRIGSFWSDIKVWYQYYD